MLQAGGNAFDAALAAACAAFVCELPLCSPMGGAVVVGRAASGELFALDAFARTPGLGASPGERDFEHVVVDFGATTQVFHVGRASAAVPLALPGLLELHRRFGSLPLSEIVAPAVELGRRGYQLGDGIAYVFQLLTPIIERSAECRRLFADGAEIARAGARLCNPDLAATLEQIARRPEAVLRDLYAALGREFGPNEGGLIGEQDVTRLAVGDAAPLVGEHAGRQIATMPAPSSGGVLVLIGLHRLAGTGRHEFLSAEHVLAMVAAQRELCELRSGDFHERCRDDDWLRALVAARPNLLGSTTHISAIDASGAAVALTLTNGEGSGAVLSGTGMVVNNLLGEEDIHPRGFHKDPPGLPLATMMAPTLVIGSNELIALGSGGSNRLRNAILSVLSHTLEHGLALDRAVAAPRLHLEYAATGSVLAFERPDLPEPAIRALGSLPDQLVEFGSRSMYFGGVHAAARRGEEFHGAGDPRRGGSVAYGGGPGTGTHNVG